MLQEYIAFWKNGLYFIGRTGRSGFWTPFVINFCLMLFFSVLTRISDVFGVLAAFFVIAYLVANLACISRRLHDTNRSAGWILIAVVPVAGTIVLLVLLSLNSVEIGNRFGMQKV